MDSPLGRAGRVYGLVCQERHCPAYAGQQRSFPRQGALYTQIKGNVPVVCTCIFSSVFPAWIQLMQGNDVFMIDQGTFGNQMLIVSAGCLRLIVQQRTFKSVIMFSILCRN